MPRDKQANDNPTQVDEAARENAAAGFTELEKGDGESGEEQVQAQLDQEEEQGFIGEKVDPRPNEDYTLRGQGRLNRRQLANGGEEGKPA